MSISLVLQCQDLNEAINYAEEFQVFLDIRLVVSVECLIYQHKTHLSILFIQPSEPVQFETTLNIPHSQASKGGMITDKTFTPAYTSYQIAKSKICHRIVSPNHSILYKKNVCDFLSTGFLRNALENTDLP